MSENPKPYVEWTATEIFDDLEQQIDNGLANAKLHIGDTPINFQVLNITSMNRCLGDNAIAMTRASTSTALVDDYIAKLTQLADAADKLQRINNYVTEYTKTNQSLRVQAMIQKIRAIIHGNDK